MLRFSVSRHRLEESGGFNLPLESWSTLSDVPSSVFPLFFWLIDHNVNGSTVYVHYSPYVKDFDPFLMFAFLSEHCVVLQASFSSLDSQYLVFFLPSTVQYSIVLPLHPSQRHFPHTFSSGPIAFHLPPTPPTTTSKHHTVLHPSSFHCVITLFLLLLLLLSSPFPCISLSLLFHYTIPALFVIPIARPSPPSPSARLPLPGGGRWGEGLCTPSLGGGILQVPRGVSSLAPAPSPPTSSSPLPCWPWHS